MKRELYQVLQATVLAFTTLPQSIYANPVCERLRHELEHHCGAGIEFFATHQNRDLMIMNAPYPSSIENSSKRLVCTYNSVPGLVSMHTDGSHCEEAANIAGNLCFRKGFSNYIDLGIDDLTNSRNCSETTSYSPLDPQLAKGYLWGSGFMRTKYVLAINNVEGYVERRPNPEYLGDDQPDSRIVKMLHSDPNFEGLRELLEAIRIETITRSQCDLLKSMLNQPLQNIGVIMLDGMTPTLEFNTSDGAVITNSPCIEVRQFFPKFNEAINYISRF